MLDWLPPEICREYGHIESSVLNGPFVRFDPSRTPDILEALERSGFHLRLDEALIRTACGECSFGLFTCLCRFRTDMASADQSPS
jgi:hypothetical protein